MPAEFAPDIDASRIIDKRQIEVAVRAIKLAKGLGAGTTESVILFGDSPNDINVVIPAGAANLEREARERFNAYGVEPGVPTAQEVEQLYGRRQ